MSPQHQAKIRWLHLSDFHFRESQAWSQDYVLSSLIKGIRDNHSGDNKPDLLFITGDVAFSGKPQEYSLAEDFIRELQKATGLSTNRTCIIPGNHDIDRNRQTDTLVGARQRLISPTEVDRFFSDTDRCETLFKRQAAFREFANRIAPPDKGGYSTISFVHTRSIKVGPLQVRVLLLDSSWLSDGGPSDIGNVLVGERQVIDASVESADPALTFALVHHPLAWLRDFEQVAVENRLIQNVHIMLRGHVHSADMRSVEALEKRITLFTAGAAFETRTSDNSYSMCTLDLLNGTGSCTNYRYIQAENEWRPDSPRSWRLLNSEAPHIDLSSALAVVHSSNLKHPNYKAVLLAGYVADVPCLVNGKVMWMSAESESGTIQNIIGPIVRRMKHLIFWKSMWKDDLWHKEIEKLDKQFDLEIERLLTIFSGLDKELLEKENKAKIIAEPIGERSKESALPVLAQLEELAAQGHWDELHEIIDHWLSADFLSNDVRAELERSRVRALLLANNITDAIEAINHIINTDSAGASDFALAARCYWAIKDYELARQYIHKALDLKVEPRTVKQLALAIAGKTGDKALAERVKCNG